MSDDTGTPKYRWRYEGGGAIVECRSWLGDWNRVALFTYGKDAKQYVADQNARREP